MSIKIIERKSTKIKKVSYRKSHNIMELKTVFLVFGDNTYIEAQLLSLENVGPNNELVFRCLPV